MDDTSQSAPVASEPSADPAPLTIDERFAALEARVEAFANTHLPTLSTDRVEAIEATIAKWSPAVEDLVAVAEAASQQQHSVWSIMSAVATKFFGTVLKPPAPPAD